MTEQDLPILTYHSIDPSGSVISTAPETFRNQMRHLAEAGYRAVTITEAWNLLCSGASLAPPFVAVTFDDGFLSIHREALPVLRDHGFTATAFIVTGRTGALSSWLASADIPPMPLVGASELQDLLDAGWELGGHSETHAGLKGLDDEELHDELIRCHVRLREWTGRDSFWFAYPYGNFDDRVKEAVRRQFVGACGTRLGWASARSDRYAVERIDMYYLRNGLVYRSLGTRRFRGYLAARRCLREVRRGPR